MSSVSAYAGSAGSAFLSNTGTKPVSNAGNMTGNVDGAYATSSNIVSNSTGSSKSFDTYNYGFSFAAGTTFQGFEVSVQMVADNNVGATATVTACQLEIGGAVGSPTVGSFNGSVISTTAGSYTCGSSNDLWGLSSTLTVANLNSAVEGTGPTIGIWFSLHTTGVHPSVTISVDAIELIVFYTAPSGGAFPLVPVSAQTVTGNRSLRAVQHMPGGVVLRSPFNPALGPLPTHIVGRYVPIMARIIEGYEVREF
jgi:hypothetical protein